MPPRQINVKVPGETPSNADQASTTEVQPEGVMPNPDPEGVADVVYTPKGATNRLSRAQYAELSADEIDPATLEFPVLTKDGWLHPSKPGPTPAIK